MQHLKGKAQALCKRSGHDTNFHGAISFLNRRPVGYGWNSNKVHGGIFKKYGQKSHHAETNAMMGVSKANSMLVVRISRKDGTLTMSKPCPLCQNFLRDKGIKKVYYSDWDSSIQEMRL